MKYTSVVTVYDQHPLTGNPRAYSRTFDESVEISRILSWGRNVTRHQMCSISDLVFSEFTGSSI